MESRGKTRDQAQNLRVRAEARIPAAGSVGAAHPNPAEVRLLHELRVHQIELEIQNEELLSARADAESALLRYTELYDSAPAGYLTLGRDGTILQVNRAAARKLRSDAASLAGSRFDLFLLEAHRPTFREFLAAVFSSRTRQSCELQLPQDGPPMTVHLEGTLSRDGSECLAVAMDITAVKEAERLSTQRHLLREIYARVAAADEERRQKVVSVLHEDVCQLLSVANLKLSQAFLGPYADPRRKALGTELVSLLESCLLKCMTLGSEVSTPVLRICGLEAALEDACERVRTEDGIPCRIACAIDPTAPLGHDLQSLLLWIARELLANAVTHSSARNIAVTLCVTQGSAVLSVEDDGRGCPSTLLKELPPDGGYGLFMVQERVAHRGGTLEFEDVLPHGLRIVVTVPLIRPARPN